MRDLQEALVFGQGAQKRDRYGSWVYTVLAINQFRIHWKYHYQVQWYAEVKFQIENSVIISRGRGHELEIKSNIKRLIPYVHEKIKRTNRYQHLSSLMQLAISDQVTHARCDAMQYRVRNNHHRIYVGLYITERRISQLSPSTGLAASDLRGVRCMGLRLIRSIRVKWR